MTSRARWLITLLEGVAAEDLNLGATPRLADELIGERALPCVQWPTGGACLEAWLHCLDAEQLRRSGVSVDQRSLLLSPTWRNDDATLHMLNRRPGGPADVTCIRLRDQAGAAMRMGLSSHAHLCALAKMETSIDRARTILRHDGENLHSLTLTFAPLTEVSRCFDAARHLLVALPRSSMRELELQQTPDRLTIRSSTNRAIDQAISVLSQAPASNHGYLHPCRSTVVFMPNTGVAFHDRALRAAPILENGIRKACAILPWHADRRKTMHIEEIAAGLSTKISVPTDPGTSASIEPPALDLQTSYPDLQTMFK